MKQYFKKMKHSLFVASMMGVLGSTTSCFAVDVTQESPHSLSVPPKASSVSISPKVETGSFQYIDGKTLHITLNKGALIIKTHKDSSIIYAATFLSKKEQQPNVASWKDPTAQEWAECKIEFSKDQYLLAAQRNSDNIESEIQVTVPQNAVLDVNVEWGRLEMDSLSGSVNARVQSGRLDLGGVTGSVNAQVDSGKLVFDSSAQASGSCYTGWVGSGKFVDGFLDPDEDEDHLHTRHHARRCAEGENARVNLKVYNGKLVIE